MQTRKTAFAFMVTSTMDGKYVRNGQMQRQVLIVLTEAGCLC